MSRPEISTDFLQMKNKVGFPDSNRDRHRLNSYRRDICNSESTFPKPLKPLRIGKLQVLQKTEVRHGADSWVTGSKSVHRIIGPHFSYIFPSPHSLRGDSRLENIGKCSAETQD